MHSERINRFFRCQKTLTSHFFTFGNKKEVIRIFWVLKNAVVWAYVWDLALSWWIHLRRFVFLITWKTTGKEMVVTVLHCSRIFSAFLSTNRHEPLFKRLTNCVGFNTNKFFWQSNVHAMYECMLVPLIPKVVSIP